MKLSKTIVLLGKKGELCIGRLKVLGELMANKIGSFLSERKIGFKYMFFISQ